MSSLFSSITYADAVATVALLFSVWAMVMSWRPQRKQEQLTDLQITKENHQSDESRKANVSANITPAGKSNKVRVFNKGPAVALNVRIEYEENNSILIPSDVQSKFPVERLEPHQKVDLIAAIHLGTEPKQTLKLIWDDESAQDQANIVYLRV